MLYNEIRKKEALSLNKNKIIKAILVVLVLVIALIGAIKIFNTVTSNEDVSYVDPVTDIYYFDTLDEDIQELILTATDGSTPSNTFFSMLGLEMPHDITLYDYDGNVVDLSDYEGQQVVLEVVASWCSYCMSESLLYIDDIIESYPDVVFIQYFASGNSNDIDSFYLSIEKDLPDNVVIIQENDSFNDWLIDAGLTTVPTFYFINEDGKTVWYHTGLLTVDEVDLITSVAYGDEIDMSSLVNADGLSYGEVIRTATDVMSELTEEEQELVASLDIDGYEEAAVYNNIGKSLSFYDGINYSEDSFIMTSDITGEEIDLSEYVNAEKVLINLILPHNGTDLLDISESTQALNDYLAEHEDVLVLNILVTYDDDATIEIYEALEVVPEGPIVSDYITLPEDFYSNIILYNLPSLFYVENGTIVGVLSGDLDAERLEVADSVFFGENSIARK